jgi:hypothetical protein
MSQNSGFNIEYFEIESALIFIAEYGMIISSLLCYINYI